MHSSRTPLLKEALGALLLAIAVTFAAVTLWPELEIGRFPPNDATLHLAATERLGKSIASGEPFLDPWVSEWSLGYPIWRSYQPLPHLVAAAVLAASPADHATTFAALQLFLLVLLPVSVFLGARLLGLDAVGAGLASCLVLAPSGAGELARYGLGLGAFTWRGSGLTTQLVALNLLVPCLGLVVRALDTGRGRWAASLLLALTSLSHIVFGYVAFVSAAGLAVAGPRGERSRRFARLVSVAVPALFLLTWFVVPLFLSRAEVNHGRWEDVFKWDSFGAPTLLKQLTTGLLLDAGRFPALSLFLAAGVAVALAVHEDPVGRRLLTLAIAWLALFFGRATWGHALLLFGVPGDMHLHRLQAAFELSAVLLAAWGLARLGARVFCKQMALGICLVACAALGLVALGIDRATYLAENARWGRENRTACEREMPDVDAALADVQAILKERPGRVSAGKAATWGKSFKVGSVPFYAFLTKAHIDQVSFLYHSMSRTSDVMVLRDEASAVHDEVFGVRAVVAPASLPVPPHWRRRGTHGRLAVFETSGEGYFGLVDVGFRYTGPPSTHYEPSAAWLASPLPAQGVVGALEGGDEGLPAVARWQELPWPSPGLLTPRGTVVSEDKSGETYRATLRLERPCYALIKLTWHPDLRVTVDGRPVPALRVTPGFGAVPVPAGRHEVVVRYAPGPLRPLLLLLGLALFACCVGALRLPAIAPVEEWAAGRLTRMGRRLAAPRVLAAIVLALVTALAMRPLFRGQLISGHDATEYPPRVAEVARVVSDGHVPPVWAPDLGNGYGQPLFEFAPPLLYATALPLRGLGLRLTDSLQVALLLLYALGAVGVYRLGRRWRASRRASLAGAAAWLLVPYVQLDLFVRAAFAEAAAMAVAPVALWCVLRAADRFTPSRVALGGVAVALCVLGHNAVALLGVPAFAAVVLARGLAGPRRARTLVGGGLAIALGLALSAFFWLPALVEKSFVKVDLLREGFLHWGKHILAPWRLLWSSWGYGLSGAGASDPMSFAIGPLHLVIGVVGILSVWRCADRARRAEALALAAIALGGATLATTLAAPLWARVEILQYLAYPWRALFLPALALPILCVPAFDRLPRTGLAAAAALVVITNLAHTEPSGYLTFDDEYYAPASIASKGINTTTREEYEPRWVERRPAWSARKLVGLDGPVEIMSQELSSIRQQFDVRAAVATRLEAATFFYPGWRAAVNGNPVSLETMPVRGTMVFVLPAGEHRVTLELLQTPVRRKAMWVSAVAAALVAMALCWPRNRVRGS